MPLIKVTCESCKLPFDKSRSRVRESERSGLRHFCSQDCFNDNRRKYGGHGSLTPCGNARRTEFTPFIRLMTMIRNRCANNEEKYGKESITINDLLDKWNEQKGICPYSGWKMLLPQNGSGWKAGSDRHRHASVDRKDASRGYTKDNIQFTCLMANLAKADFSDEALRDFCKAVSERR